MDCLTDSCLKFVIQLWRNEDDDAIILEVQRRRGCAIAMQRLRKSLYNSVRSSENEALSYVSPRRPSLILEKRMCDELKEKNESHKASRFDARLLCLELLESDKKDENRLGVESLLILTDLSKVTREDAEEVARAVIYNEGELATRLLNSFVAFFNVDVDKRFDEPDWSFADCSNSDDASLLEFSQGSEFGDTHLLALKVLTNCLQVIACHEQDYLSNEITSLDLASPFWREIMDALVLNLHESSHRPQEAALSAKCMRILECLEPGILTPFLESVVAPLLVHAHEFGKAHHLFLEKESEELMQSLEAASETGGFL